MKAEEIITLILIVLTTLFISGCKDESEVELLLLRPESDANFLIYAPNDIDIIDCMEWIIVSKKDCNDDI